MELAILEEAAAMYGGQRAWLYDGAGIGGGVVAGVWECGEKDKFEGGKDVDERMNITHFTS